ncbi:cation diffusion facilitator family transporter [Amycolatopsis suaedae]|uniref:Cation transporter n=1 Tax=Amycolatopsis suaedae TaxID=2510978 RepID=A0A4Q7J0E6_9PSEU|nr:cation diffusion facilitator family transporter [Amycolatopsis suaedae]RZQ60269.1 cation transporter [Amycolatopsis suaedae]
MGHGHGHGNVGSASGRHARRLGIALALGVVTLAVQLVVGLRTSSLALLSDSAHVLTDVLGVAMALGAVLVARRAAANGGRTFGMYRGEVLAALLNAVLLVAVAAWVLTEAVGRFADPPEVPGLPVTIVAVAGLLLNLAALLVLRRGAAESLNVRGAYLEVMADLVGSVGVLISGLLTLGFGWRYADAVIGVAIGLFVLPRAVRLGRDALRILFQHAPARLDVAAVRAELADLPGVLDVHDLHVWTLTSGMEVASAHLRVAGDADRDGVLERARGLLTERHGLGHATLQVEVAACPALTW